ncbi:MAG: hypothetical protein ACRD5Z_12430, partial [Bryobacteraceae bacterium]
MSPGEGLLLPFLHNHTFSTKGVAGLAFAARIERPASISSILPSSLVLLSRNGTRVGPTAPVERAQKIIRLH